MRLNPAVFLLIAIVVIPAGQVCVARFGLNKRLREFVSDTWTRIALPGQRCEWSALGLHDEGQVALAMHLVRRHRARRADVAMVMLRHADLVLSELTVGFPDDKSATFYTNNRLRNVVWLMERVPVPRRRIMDWLQVIVFSPDAERTVLNEEWMPKVTDLLQNVPKRVPTMMFRPDVTLDCRVRRCTDLPASSSEMLMPRPPRDTERDRLLAQQSIAVVQAAQEMEDLVERLLDTALSLPTRLEQIQALTALSRLLSSPHDHGTTQSDRQPLVKRVHSARQDLFLAANTDPEDRMSWGDIAVATGMTKEGARRASLTMEQKAPKKTA